MLTSTAHIHEIFAEALGLQAVVDGVKAGKAKPELYRVSRRSLKAGGPRSYRGFARYASGQISLTIGSLCDEANAAVLILHEIAHIISPERGHGTGFKLTFCQLVEELYGVHLFSRIGERYHNLDALAAIEVALLLADGEEPEEESSAWWTIEKAGRRSWPRYFNRTERKHWELVQADRAARAARVRAWQIKQDRIAAAAAGRIA